MPVSENKSKQVCRKCLLLSITHGDTHTHTHIATLTVSCTRTNAMPILHGFVIYASKILIFPFQIVFNFGQGYRKSFGHNGHWTAINCHRMERRLVSTNEKVSKTHSCLRINPINVSNMAFYETVFGLIFSSVFRFVSFRQ